MRKFFYLTYGSSTITKEEAEKILRKEFDIIFEERDSLYLGAYYCYSGVLADFIRILENYNDEMNYFICEKNEDCKMIIEISIEEGRNKDKIVKCETIKEKLNGIDGLSLLSNTCLTGD